MCVYFEINLIICIDEKLKEEYKKHVENKV